MATSAGPPSDIPNGPVFVDTAACRCSLQQASTAASADTVASSDQQLAWRCVGKSTASMTSGTSGKWFLSQNQDPPPPQDLSNPPYNWAGDSPSTQDPQINSQGSPLPLAPSNNYLSLQDSACTGKNDTIESTRFYGWLHGNGPGVCKVSDKVVQTPLMQNASDWLQDGCLPGFYCPNNNINRLPVYCPPTPECLGLASLMASAGPRKADMSLSSAQRVATAPWVARMSRSVRPGAFVRTVPPNLFHAASAQHVPKAPSGT